MISLRYHTVSIAAVFLALAVGVLLGSTSVSETLVSAVSGERDSLSKQVRQLRAERNELEGRLEARRDFTRSIVPRAVQGALADTGVTVISTSGVSSQHREAVKRTLTSSGARVTGVVRLTDAFTDPEEFGHMRDVASRVLPAGVRLPVGAGPGKTAAALLGPLTMTGSGAGESSGAGDRTAAFAGLREGGFLRVNPDFTPGEVAVVLADGRHREEDESAATVARFAGALDRYGSGVVLAGATGSAHGNGAVGIARSDSGLASNLSTVDNGDTAPGRIATVLALRQHLDGKTGHFGMAASAQGPLPASRG